MLSREGPHIAVADVNNDGLEDVYIGGAKGQAGQLYLQNSNGFIKKEEKVFDQFSEFEDVAVLFFDCDGDRDMDLFVGAGGNNVPPKRKQLRHRLYKNDGEGNFVIDTTAFPHNDMNISVAAENDFDNDGDIDLFVGQPECTLFLWGNTFQLFISQRWERPLYGCGSVNESRYFAGRNGHGGCVGRCKW